MVANEILTVFLVEYNLQFELSLALERLVDLQLVVVHRVRAVQELARAALLHDLRTREPRELAEPIRAVDDRVYRRNLRVAQHEVTVCNRNEKLQGVEVQWSELRV